MRFAVTYRMRAADAAEARARAEGIALEQTVEVPRAVVPEGYITDEIVGRIEEIGPAGEGVFHAVISYSPDSAGDEIAQFLRDVAATGIDHIQVVLDPITVPGVERLCRIVETLA